MRPCACTYIYRISLDTDNTYTYAYICTYTVHYLRTLHALYQICIQYIFLHIYIQSIYDYDIFVYTYMCNSILLQIVSYCYSHCWALVWLNKSQGSNVECETDLRKQHIQSALPWRVTICYPLFSAAFQRVTAGRGHNDGKTLAVTSFAREEQTPRISMDGHFWRSLWHILHHY